ncbi:predicted protein [Plenodomus lingam JN3]|uniref:Uncharacterized protein n=1 Tax=Leptosphaeria maculans (strain JN3 / isolate v23.1.3 / race Av1-4-5-6-7-8) TaxID=985895 RepID=E5A7E0_LEPMJ|nr:predicted protein [Plenodomus lingam JN3]CBX99535.1 predicted protein [Plenodomus lingam JN3]
MQRKIILVDLGIWPARLLLLEQHSFITTPYLRT